MDVRRESRLGISVLLIVQVLLCMLSISVLTRMGPAIERILEENVYSAEAVEEMIAILALHNGQGPVPPAFSAAQRRVQDNVTEAEEEPFVQHIGEDAPAAFSGDRAARARLVESLRKLGEVNRKSMRVADDRAQRLGQTGAWAAVVLGTCALAVGIVVYRRLRLRLELPLEYIRRTMHAVRTGNRRARCGTVDGPTEVEQIAENIDWSLDHSQPLESPVSGPPPSAARDTALRRALAWMSTQHGQTLVLRDESGKLVFGDRLAFESLCDDAEAWREEPLEGTSLRVAVRTETEPQA